MERPEAQALLATLLAAFRPRDFGAPSEELYVRTIEEFEFADGQEAVRFLIRETDFLPSVHGLIEAMSDCRRMRMDAFELPWDASSHVLPRWSAEDEASAKELLGPAWGSLPQIGWPKRRENRPPLKVDESEVRMKREAAARAKEKLLKEQESE